MGYEAHRECHRVGVKGIMGIIKVLMNKVGGYLEMKKKCNLLNLLNK